MMQCLVITLALLPTRIPAQTSSSFDPFPGGTASNYRFNFSRTLFASADAERRQRDSLITTLNELASASADLPATATQLLRLLQRADTLERKLGRHYAYLSLRPVIDERDTDASRNFNALAQHAQSSLTPLYRSVGQLSDTVLARFVRELPALRRYQFAFDGVRALRARTIPDSLRATANSLEAQGYTWGPQRFRQILNSIDFGKVSAPEGALDVRANGSHIYNHSDRSVREAGYRANVRGITTRADSFALVLTETARARNTLARYRGFRDHRDESYGERYLSVSDVDRMLDALARASLANRRFEQLRSARLRAVFGLDSVHYWDWAAPPPGLTPPRMTAPEAIRTIVASVAPLGNTYQAEMTALLDTANGRLDISPRPDRVDRPGFSTGSVGYPSMLFQGRFEGFIDNTVILAHEAGHGVQNMLMERRGVLARYAGGPGYFTESYAALNEMLLFEHLIRTARDGATRTYYLERLIDQSIDVFRNAYESRFEDRLYETIAAGRSLNAAGVESLFNNTASEYSTRFGTNVSDAVAWSRPLQFFTRPLYRVNYVYARVLALNYLARMKSDSTFTRRYLSLLSRGYDGPPVELLREETGIDLAKPEPVVAIAIAQLDGWITELERIYRE